MHKLSQSFYCFLFCFVLNTVLNSSDNLTLSKICIPSYNCQCDRTCFFFKFPKTKGLQSLQKSSITYTPFHTRIWRKRMVCYLLLYLGYTILECNDICILILNLKKWVNEKIFIIINFSKPLNLKIKSRLIITFL